MLPGKRLVVGTHAVARAGHDSDAHVDEDSMPVALELRIGRRPIQGRLRTAEGTWQAFRGWLELTALLESAQGDEPRTDDTTERTP